MRIAAPLCGMILAAIACFHPARPDPAADSPSGRGPGELAIRVVNQNFSDVVVYLYEHGHPSRLGRAGGEHTTLFFLPWRRVATGTLQLVADPIGGSTLIRTEVLSVRPGSIVVWTIASVLTQSNAAVY